MILTLGFSDVEAGHIENTQKAIEKIQTAIAVSRKCVVTK